MTIRHTRKYHPALTMAFSWRWWWQWWRSNGGANYNLFPHKISRWLCQLQLAVVVAVVTADASVAALLLLFRPHLCCLLWFLRHLRRLYLLLDSYCSNLPSWCFYLFGSPRFVCCYCCCCCCCCCCCSARYHRRFLMVPSRRLLWSRHVCFSLSSWTFLLHVLCLHNFALQHGTYRVNFTRE